MSGHSGRFPVHAGKSPPASFWALAPAPAARIALLFLSGLLFAADPGERGAGWAARVGVGGGKLDADQAGKKSLAGQLSGVGGVEG